MRDNLPAVPWADLMDEAEATYWDAENVHGTDAGIRTLAEWAYRKGIASVHTCGSSGDFGAVENLRRYECTGEDHKLVMLGRCTYRDVEDGTYLSARYPS